MVSIDSGTVLKKRGGQPKRNKYFIDGDIVTGFTHKGEPFIFDFIKFNEIVKYSWLMDNEGYIFSCVKDADGKLKKLRMHRFILDLGNDYTLLPDHINRNRNDNRRSNLRLVNSSENGFNRDISISNKSGITGVFYRERIGKTPKWIASINIKGICKQIGQFNTKDEAIVRRLEAEKENVQYAN